MPLQVQPYTTTLGQSHIPMIVPSSGTIAPYGALTLSTALPIAYPGAYLYFPATALWSTSQAGWYYTTFTSTTVGTVYNNQYLTGTPIVPLNLGFIQQRGSGAYTQASNADIAGYNFTIPGYTLGDHDGIRVWYALSTSSLGAAKVYKIQLISPTGSTVIRTGTLTVSAFDNCLTQVYNRGSRTQQISVPVNNTNQDFGTTASTVSTYSIDFRYVQNFTVTMNLANAADYIVLETINVEQTIANIGV